MDAGAAVHEVTIAALRVGMRDGSIRRPRQPMLLAMTLWSFTHAAIQVPQTKGAFLAEARLSSAPLLQSAIELALHRLRPPTTPAPPPARHLLPSHPSPPCPPPPP